MPLTTSQERDNVGITGFKTLRSGVVYCCSDRWRSEQGVEVTSIPERNNRYEIRSQSTGQ